MTVRITNEILYDMHFEHGQLFPVQIQELQKMKAYMAEREITKMNTNDMKELNINELEQVNGGRSKSLLEIWFENQYLSNKNDD